MELEINELEYFYKLVINQLEVIDVIQRTSNAQWIIIFEENCSKLTVGISQIGQWVLKCDKDFYVLKERKMYLYCVRLLEIPYNEVQQQIEDRYKKIFENEDIEISTIFPFFEIVEFAFSNLLDDYWFTLAWVWYTKLSIHERMKLIDVLDNISKFKKISQRNRQKAAKEVKRIRKIINMLEK